MITENHEPDFFQIAPISSRHHRGTADGLSRDSYCSYYDKKTTIICRYRQKVVSLQCNLIQNLADKKPLLRKKVIILRKNVESLLLQQPFNHMMSARPANFGMCILLWQAFLRHHRAPLHQQHYPHKVSGNSIFLQRTVC